MTTNRIPETETTRTYTIHRHKLVRQLVIQEEYIDENGNSEWRPFGEPMKMTSILEIHGDKIPDEELGFEANHREFDRRAGEYCRQKMAEIRKRNEAQSELPPPPV